MIKHTIRVLTLALSLPCAFLLAQTASPAARQGTGATRPANAGVVKGVVKDDSGGVIPNATVTLTDQGGITRTAHTQNDGSYAFRGVAPGAYTVSVERKGLAQAAVVAVSVAAGQPAEGDVVMTPEKLKEEVTVAENNTTQVSTDPSQNATQLVLKKEDLAALPDDPDDLAQDLQALAGPSAGPGGGQIYIDGFSSGRLPPKESIREIRINQNPFSSEYDRLGFGRIEIFTKPGSDKFHGTAFYTISDGALNSRNPFLTVTPDFRTQNFGGNVSGPVNKHASFFIDFERRQIDDNGILNALVLGPADQGYPLLNNRGFVPTPQQRMTISPRLDWQLGTNNTLSLRYSYLDNHRDLSGVSGFNLPDNGFSLDDNEHTAQITETAVLSSKVVNETHFQYRRENEFQTALSNTPQISVPGAFTTGGAGVGQSMQSSDKYELQNYTSIAQGTHSIKFGARIRGYKLDYNSPRNFNGSFTFGSLEAYRLTLEGLASGQSMEQIQAMGGGPLQFTINSGNPALGVNQVDVGAFVQDDWRVAPNLTLSGGLRYETQTNIHDWRDIAPRAGFAWSPSFGKTSGRPKTVVRGGFGLFYLRFDDTDVLTAEQYNGVTQQSYLVKDPLFFGSIPPLSSLSDVSNQQIRYLIDKNLRAPYLIQSAIGIDQQLFKGTTLAVNFTNTRGVHQYRTRDINAPIPGTVDPSAPQSGVRPYGNVGDLYLFESSGLLKQSQLMVRVNSQIGSRVSLFGAYIWSNAHSNTDGLQSLPVNQYNTDAEWARSSLDIRSRMFLGGSVRAPFRIQLSPFILASSGRPYDITTGFDNNLDGVKNDRPGLANGPGAGIIATPYGFLNPNPTAGEPLITRNIGNGPNMFTINMRLSRTWGFGTTKYAGVVGGARAGQGRGGRFGGGPRGGGDSLTEHRYNMTLSISARNLFNHVNDNSPVGVLASPFFLQSTGIAGGFGAESTPTNNRRLEFQLRFQF